MSPRTARPAIRPSVQAVQTALLALALSTGAQGAESDEVSVEDLVAPVRQVQLGFGAVSNDSFRSFGYGDYHNAGAFPLLDLLLESDSNYQSGDRTRWRIEGHNLGLDDPSLQVQLGEAGSYKLTFDYSRIRHYTSDSYTTPYRGVGTNFLTLPSNWVVPEVPQNSGTNAGSLSTTPNARALDPATGLDAPGAYYPAAVPTPKTLTSPPLTAANAAKAVSYVNSVLANDPGDFQKVDLFTDRERYKTGAGLNLTPQWDASVSFTQEHKTGLQMLGSVTAQSGGDISTILPLPIDQTTNQIAASTTYHQDGAFVTAAYYGSMFNNNLSTVSWRNWALPTAGVNTMTTNPDNQFHQLTLTGGYDLPWHSKAVGDLSYGRATQNESFLYGPEAVMGLPAGVGNSATSLDGLVITRAADLKLTSRPMAGLSLTGNLKYESRDDRTPVNTFVFYDVGETPSGNSVFNAPLGLASGTLGSNVNIEQNRPYSRTLRNAALAADYQVVPGQNVKVSYDFSDIYRYCNGTWFDCVDAANSKEQTFGAQWRGHFDEFEGRFGLSTAIRRVDPYNEDAFLALVPMANAIPNQALANTGGYSLFQTLSLFGLTGFGPVTTSGYPLGAASGNWTAAQWGKILGLPATSITAAELSALNYYFANGNAAGKASYASNNVISELLGMRRYDMADRDRNKVHASLGWQPTDRLSFQVGADYNHDNYLASEYGLRDGQGWVLNLDGSYAASDRLALDVYFTHESMRSAMASDAYGNNAAGTGTGAYVGRAGDTVAQSCSSAIQTVAEKAQNAKMDPCLQWSMDSSDSVNTLGASFKQRQFVSARFTLTGDLSYSKAQTNYNVNGGSYVNNPLALAAPTPSLGTSAAVFYILASAFPTVTTQSVDFRLRGEYTIDRKQAIRVSYAWEYLKAVDYAYDGLQFGSMVSVLPTAQTAPAYRFNAVSVAYVINF